MIVKSNKEQLNDMYLINLFNIFWMYNMILNLEKLTMRVRVDKFLSFYLTKWGI